MWVLPSVMIGIPTLKTLLEQDEARKAQHSTLFDNLHTTASHNRLAPYCGPINSARPTASHNTDWPLTAAPSTPLAPKCMTKNCDWTIKGLQSLW